MSDRIETVEVHAFSYDVSDVGMDGGGQNISYRPGNVHTLGSYAVVITCADGSRGEYVAMWGGSPMSLAQTRALAPLLVGRDPTERERIFDDCKRAHRQYDHMGYGALDIALWDLMGKRAQRPIAELLGVYRRDLPAYASSFHGDREGGLSSPEDYADFAEQCLGLGYPAFKIHGWCEGDPAEESAAILRIAERVGDRMEVMVDPACELRTFADMLEVGRACDEAGVRWYEDPMRDSGVSHHAYRRLREAIDTPILQTEHVRGIEPKADFVVAGATDLLRADPEYDLGITGVMKIAHIGEGFGMDVEIHASGPAHRHCMAAMRNTSYYEVALVHPKVPNPVPPVYACEYSDQLEAVGTDGTFPVPTGPGLGVTYDWDFIRDHRTAVDIYS